LDPAKFPAHIFQKLKKKLICGTIEVSGVSALIRRRQARNQFGTPGGAKNFLRGAQIFKTISNTFFHGGVAKILAGGRSPPAPPLVTGLGTAICETEWQ